MSQKENENKKLTHNDLSGKSGQSFKKLNIFDISLFKILSDIFLSCELLRITSPIVIIISYLVNISKILPTI